MKVLRVSSLGAYANDTAVLKAKNWQKMNKFDAVYFDNN